MDERATKTILALGEISVPVALYRTAGEKQGETKFDRAGPNGGRLKAPAPPGFDPPEEEPIASGKLTVPEGLDIFSEDPECVGGVPDNEPEYRVAASSYPLLVEEGSGVEIHRTQDMLRGIFDYGGTFHDLTEHLAAVDTITRLDEMRVEGFIQRNIPVGRITGSYWIAPDGQGNVLRLLWAAMADEFVAAVVRWTKRTRQALGVITPHGGGLLLLELSWAETVREPRPEVGLMTDRAVEVAHLRLARELVRAMAIPATQVDTYEDEGARLRRELRAEALAGKDPEVPQPKTDEAPTAALAEALT